jgi:hypothetical protein
LARRKTVTAVKKRELGLGVFLGAALLVAACGDDPNIGPVSPNDGTGSGAGGSGAGGPTTGSGAGTGTGTGTGTTPPEEECPHEGEDVLDPSALPVCPSCAGGARCLPNALIPADNLEQLGACDGESSCVPDEFIRTGGNFIATTCTSIAGAEGRCLSECLPDVAEKAANLPVDICGEFNRCVPCFDPLSGEETGACALSCDPGASEPPVTLPKCCDGIGTCVPKSAVPPEQAESLPQDECPEDASEFVCAPDVYINDPGYTPTSCETDGLFGGGEAGVCVPDCLVTGIQGALVGQSTCQDDWKCAPCTNPLTGEPTGACPDLGG